MTEDELNESVTGGPLEPIGCWWAALLLIYCGAFWLTVLGLFGWLVWSCRPNP